MGALPIVIVAVVQGWALYGLHVALDNRAWPATEPGWLFALYAVALLLPLALELLAKSLRERATWILAAAIAGVAGALGGYAGWQIGTQGNGVRFGTLAGLYGPLFFAWFIALPFVQARLRRGRWKPSYPDLFEFSHQNALVLLEAFVFTGAFWLLLWLWAGLFSAIGIRFFAELFSKAAFIYPIGALVFGYAVYLIEWNERIVVALRRHLLGVFSWLAPLVAVIALAFLVALPFTGLEPLWKTGRATSLMLWLQLLFVHLVNSAYQDGETEPRYPAWLKLFMRLAVLTLPIYAGLCAYSLGVRVDQYGWSIDRVWAALGTFLAGLYGLGYAYAALRRTPWMASLARVNLGLAVLSALVLLLAVSPVLDPRRIATASQVERLASGRVTAARFDFNYLRFDLGRHGRDALRELAGSQEAEVARLAAAAIQQTSRYQARRNPPPVQDLASRIELVPAGAQLDPAFVAYLKRVLAAESARHPSCLRLATQKPCLMLAIDLDADGQFELVTFSHSYPRAVYAKRDGEWAKVGHLISPGVERGAEELVRNGRVETAPRSLRDLVVGDARYTVQSVRER